MARHDPSTVITRVRRVLDRYGVRRGKVLVAVSGGPDSIALLQALVETANGHDLKLLAAHLNHRLRGEESDADATFVKQFSRERSLLCLIDETGPGELLPGQSHLESTSRRLRYRWLEMVARREGCPWVMTGHTADDQAETVLHHLLRGTGLRGQRGIAPMRKLRSASPYETAGPPWRVLLVRPLLLTGRNDILAFLGSRGIVARQDRSNDDLTFTRNRLRHKVLPLLEETVNRDAVRHLAQLAQRARELYPVIHRRAVKLLRSAKIQDVGHVAVFDQRPLRRAAVAVLQEALRQLWRRQGWPLAAMCAERWYGVIRVCRGERTAVQLPGGVTVRQRLNVVQFSRNEPAA